MKRPLLTKGLMIGGMALLLLIPLSMVQGLVEARNGRQIEAEKDISRLHAGNQQLTGPLLVARYDEQVVTETKNKDTGETTSRTTWLAHHQVVVPKDLDLAGQAKVDVRNRGIFKAQAYDLEAQIQGRFSIPAGLGLSSSRPIRLGRAYLVLGLSDLRGIQKRPVLTWAGRGVEWRQGAVDDVLNSAVHADLGPLTDLEGREWDFSLLLTLRGTQGFSMAPVAEATRATLKSSWSSPSFQGRFAAKHDLSEQGFTATWEVFHLARNLRQILEDKGKTDESFGVFFQSPMNIYLQSERATKYGFLFVGLVFAAFFFVELLRKLPIHPLQYLMVGLALALFFLLLLSLSEHVGFTWAYLAASVASLVLLGVYLVHVLRSRSQGWGFALGLSMVFAVLYGLILSEDNALVMGSSLLFLGLAALMISTRKVDWYALTAGGASEGETR